MSRNTSRWRDPRGEHVTETDLDAPPVGERWSSWDVSTHGPGPRPPWVITELGAVEQDLGVLKTGKEADVHLVRRWVPGHEGDPNRDVVMAAKRFRPGERRLFHRDAGYLEGRRVRRSRETRAMARRTEFGREVIAAQWAGAEFAALARLWQIGLPVPYPVQLSATEMLLEFIGRDHVAAPRLAQLRPDRSDLVDLFGQVLEVLESLADLGLAHGDLSAYNVLVDQGRIVVIDWPQIVDVVGNPQGFDFLERDVRTICTWFTGRGLALDSHEVFGDLAARVAGSGWR